MHWCPYFDPWDSSCHIYLNTVLRFGFHQNNVIVVSFGRKLKLYCIFHFHSCFTVEVSFLIRQLLMVEGTQCFLLLPSFTFASSFFFCLILDTNCILSRKFCLILDTNCKLSRKFWNFWGLQSQMTWKIMVCEVNPLVKLESS